MEINLCLKNERETEALGKILAEALIRESFLPVRGIYLFGDLGAGKTTFTRSLVATLPGGDNAEPGSPSFTICNEYPTRPVILHADLYRLGPGSPLPEEMEEGLENGCLLIMEWAEYLAANAFEPERLEIYLHKRAVPKSVQALENLDILGQSCQIKRLAGLKAYGKSGTLFLERLKPVLQTRFATGEA